MTKPAVVHDAEFYLSEVANRESWASEDAQISER